jgi:hypothetical protein
MLHSSCESYRESQLMHYSIAQMKFYIILRYDLLFSQHDP